MTARRILRDDERRAWLRLRLTRTETIGATRSAVRIARFGDVREALDAVPRLARHGGAKEWPMPSQATERSGSLITANYALEQGREVFAGPRLERSIRAPRVPIV